AVGGGAQLHGCPSAVGCGCPSVADNVLMRQRFLRRRRQAERDEGAVTAEMAMAVPVLVLLAWAAMWFVSVLGVQARCVEAARAAERAGARGDDPAAAARQLLPAGAKLRVTRTGAWLEVDVTDSRPPP